MFEYMKEFSRILVSGPQRSGTRICAQMIAQDNEYKLIDETGIYIDSMYQLIKELHQENIVIQCPALSVHVHRFGVNDSVAIIFMKRPIKDIIASQERIKWPYEYIELLRYNAIDGPIAEVKYMRWETQKTVVKNWFEVKYESLKEHPLWISKDQRQNFGPLQTSVENAGIPVH